MTPGHHESSRTFAKHVWDSHGGRTSLAPHLFPGAFNWSQTSHNALYRPTVSVLYRQYPFITWDSSRHIVKQNRNREHSKRPRFSIMRRSRNLSLVNKRLSRTLQRDQPRAFSTPKVIDLIVKEQPQNKKNTQFVI